MIISPKNQVSVHANYFSAEKALANAENLQFLPVMSHLVDKMAKSILSHDSNHRLLLANGTDHLNLRGISILGANSNPITSYYLESNSKYFVTQLIQQTKC